MYVEQDIQEALPAWQTQSWGGETSLRCHDRCQLRHIVLRPGCATEPEAHCHHTEHWIVIQGIARAEIGGAAHDIAENGTHFVPVGQRHRITNPGRIDLHMIVVETGSYLEPDDTVAA